MITFMFSYHCLNHIFGLLCHVFKLLIYFFEKRETCIYKIVTRIPVSVHTCVQLYSKCNCILLDHAYVPERMYILHIFHVTNWLFVLGRVNDKCVGENDNCHVGLPACKHFANKLFCICLQFTLEYKIKFLILRPNPSSTLLVILYPLPLPHKRPTWGQTRIKIPEPRVPTLQTWQTYILLCTTSAVNSSQNRIKILREYVFQKCSRPNDRLELSHKLNNRSYALRTRTWPLLQSFSCLKCNLRDMWQSQRQKTETELKYTPSTHSWPISC